LVPSTATETPSEISTPADGDFLSTSNNEVADTTGEVTVGVEEPGLPLRTGQDPVPRSPQPSRQRNEASNSPTPTPRPAKFLLVDDNPVNLKMISHHMKKLGHSFDTATDGKEAFDAVQASGGQYSCIFMDIQMPTMDGFEATRLVRAFEREEHLPRCLVFALTGIASEAAQEEAFASGIDLFLTKPVKLKELNRILEEKNLA